MKILLGLAILLIVYFKIGFKEIIELSLDINPFYFIPIVIILIVSFFVAAINIKILTNQVKKIGIITILRYYSLGWALGLFALGKLGELSLIYFLRKHKITIGEGFAISIIDKGITVFVLGASSIIGFYLFFREGMIYVSLFLLAGFLISGFAIMNSSIRKWVRKHILRKYEDKFKGFYKLIIKIMQNKKVILLNIFLTVIKWCMSFGIMYLLFIALGAKVSYINVFIISSFSVIVSLVPITMSGLGAREAVGIYAYSLINVDPQKAAAAYLLINFINYSAATKIQILIKTTKNKEIGND